jgi:hypothetical protein
MDQARIFQGFLRANVGFTDDHDVARDFLTDELAGRWRPTSQVTVYEGDPEIVSDGNEVSVTVSVLGQVGERGHLNETPAGATVSERFEMTRVAGEWRISALPDDFGLWLTQADFLRLYRTATVNYLTETTAEFVADVRWFPRYPQGAGLPTALARAQLEPPPEYLRRAVINGVPDEVELTATGVPVDPATGTATVDLTSVGSSGTPAQQRQMWAQFTKTLVQAPGVTSVQVQAGGRVLPVDGDVDSLSNPAELGFSDPDSSVEFGLLRVRNELTPVDPAHYRLETYEPAEGVELPELPGVPVRWADLATTAEVDDFAAVSVDGQTLWRWRAGSEYEMGGIGTELTGPSYDGSGHLWVAGRSSTGPRVWALDLSDAPRRAVARPVEADWLGAGTEVLAFEVAPDGARALIHTRDAESGQEQLALTGIVRNDDGEPVSLTAPWQIAGTLTSVTSIEWVSPLALVALAQRDGDRVPTPYVVPLGGWVEAYQPVSQATDITGVAGPEQALIVLTEQGRIYTQEGSDWSTGRNGDDVIIPGR